MTMPYGPPGSDEPKQAEQQPRTQGYPGIPSGVDPAQDPNRGYPQPGYGYQSYGQGYPQSGYSQQDLYRQPAPAGQPYGPQQDYPQYGPQGYQAYGPQLGHQPYPGDHDQPAYGVPRKKSALPWILSGLAGAAILAVILVVGFVTPGFFTTTVFDQNAVQEGVQRILSDEYGQQAQSVTCPADQEVRTGSTFTCQATIDGAQRNVTITVKTDAGEYEVARPN
ncbi:MAG: DUF4333 domain-containing protein [Pseudonocardiaceae bacterium]